MNDESSIRYINVELLTRDILKELLSLEIAELGNISTFAHTRDRESTHELKVAQTALQHSTVKDAICAALKSTTDDAFEIAKVITPVLATLVLSHIVQMALDPLVFACIALVISKAGVAGFCHEENKDEKTKRD